MPQNMHCEPKLLGWKWNWQNSKRIFEILLSWKQNRHCNFAKLETEQTLSYSVMFLLKFKGNFCNFRYREGTLQRWAEYTFYTHC
jgi:hypothetical protein